MHVNTFNYNKVGMMKLHKVQYLYKIYLFSKYVTTPSFIQKCFWFSFSTLLQYFSYKIDNIMFSLA